MNQTPENAKNKIPLAESHDEWRSLDEGTMRILAGRFFDANSDKIVIRTESGDLAPAAIQPPVPFQLDMLMNQRFMQGARRAIRVRATSNGWVTTISDMMDDEEGHDAVAPFFSPFNL